MALVFNNENFEKEILNYKGVALVDFWAEWCGPCRMLGPVIESLAEKFSGKVKIGKVNVDDCGNLAGQYNISSIPCLKFFKNGQVVATTVGVKSEAELESLITEKLLK